MDELRPANAVLFRRIHQPFCVFIFILEASLLFRLFFFMACLEFLYHGYDYESNYRIISRLDVIVKEAEHRLVLSKTPGKNGKIFSWSAGLLYFF